METIQERQIEGTSPLAKTAAWRPAASSQIGLMLAAIRRRRSFGSTSQFRLIFWLDKRNARIRPMAGFQPVSLHWYRQDLSSLSSTQPGKGLWRHEYLVRREYVYQESSGRNRDAEMNGARHSGDKPIYTHGQQLQNAMTSPNIFNPKHLLQGQEEQRAELSLATSWQPRKKIASSQNRKEMQAVNLLPGIMEQESELILATSRQPRKEIPSSQNRSGTHQQDSVSARKHDVLQPLIYKSEDSHISILKTVKPVSPAHKTSNLVNDLFDRAMQSQPLPELDLQFLPMLTATVSIAEDSNHEKQEQMAPAPRAMHDDTFIPPPVLFSHSDVNRVADRVAHILKQKERLERERWGRY